jgi:hypothetical protein
MWTRAAILFCSTFVCCTSAPSPGPRTWHVHRVLEAGEKLGGCAAGDVLPDVPGPELVTVAASGAVWVAWREGITWHSEKAFTAPGEMIQVACGDVLAASPGDEIVVVGMARGRESSSGPGAAYLISRRDDAWVATQIATSTRLLHGTCVAREGVVVTGFENTARLVRFPDGAPVSGPVVTLPGAGKTALEVGNSVIIACDDGSLVAVDWSDRSVITLDERPSGRARLGSDGHRIVVADDDGTLSIVTPSGRTEIFRESDKLRGAVLADLDTDAEGIEAACAGYRNRITVLRQTTGGWRPELVHEATDRLHHLLAVRLDEDAESALVACGYSGALILVDRR